MSRHVVEIVPVTLLPHPNADTLSIVRVHGWQAIVRTADWLGRSLGAYVPPDSIVPEGLVPGIAGRVRAVRLRGEISEGLLVPAPEGYAIGDDVMAVLGVTHYEPAPETVSGDDAPAPDGYIPVYDVENARRYSDSRWAIGAELVVTEKIHGENWRATCRDGQVHVASRTRWKAERDQMMRLSHFWLTLTGGVRAWLEAHPGCVLYGETYGGVGGFPYDVPPGGGRRLAVFDVWDPERRAWWTWDEMADLPRAPELARVVWGGDLATLAPYAEGPSTLNAKHIREGAVIRPVVETGSTAVGERAVLKLVGRGYLSGKVHRE